MTGGEVVLESTGETFDEVERRRADKEEEASRGSAPSDRGRDRNENDGEGTNEIE